MSEALEQIREARPRRFRPYPEYKDSGVEWLGEIPAHWGSVRIAEHARLINGFPFDSAQFTLGEGMPLVRIRDLDSSDTEVRYAGSPVEDALVKHGDILIGMDGEFNVGRWKGQDALLNQRMCCLRPFDSLSGQYLLYSVPFPLKIINDLTYSTTVKHLSSFDVRKIRLSYPPRSEQDVIASFLDRETAKIDALVAKKERLIELLQEKRSALITRAVTRGLDPNVPLKSSGVDWLGEIPAHWETKRIKNIASFVTSGSRGWAEYYADEGPIFLRIGNLCSDSIELNLDDVQHVSPPRGTEGERTRVRGRDVLISITALIGAVGVVPDHVPEAFVNQHLALVRPRDDQVDPRWLAYCVLSRVGQAQFSGALYGGTKDGLGLEDIRSLLVLAPPLNEQQAIVELLDSVDERIDTLILRAEDGIDRLVEFRTALTSAAVTGKIDVREEVA